MPRQLKTSIDVQSLIDDGVRESQQLEFKQQFPDARDPEAKLEFLRDVSSMANASGGDVIFGVQEDRNTGTALAIQPMPSWSDPDERRFRQVVESNLEPRLVALGFRPIEVPGGTVVVLSIGASHSAPHMITLGGKEEFYLRVGPMKTRMDVNQLRDAFLRRQSLSDRAQHLHVSSVANMFEGRTPYNVWRTARLVVHVVPGGAWTGAATWDPRQFQKHSRLASAPWMDGTPSIERFNADGFFTFTPGEGTQIDSYGLFSRTGYCELSIGLDGQVIGTLERPTLRGPVIEKELVKAVDRCLRVFEKLEITAPPVVVEATLLSAQNYRIARSDMEHTVGVPTTVDRDCCRLAGVTMEELPPDGQATALALRPLLDSLYQAASRDGSISFNSDGSLGPLWESL